MAMGKKLNQPRSLYLNMLTIRHLKRLGDESIDIVHGVSGDDPDIYIPMIEISSSPDMTYWYGYYPHKTMKISVSGRALDRVFFDHVHGSYTTMNIYDDRFSLNHHCLDHHRAVSRFSRYHNA